MSSSSNLKIFSARAKQIIDQFEADLVRRNLTLVPTMEHINCHLKYCFLTVLLATFAMIPSARAVLNCAPDAIHELNRQDQKLCVAGVEKLDAMLNASFKAATERLNSEPQRSQLRTEQRAWLRERNRCESTACFTKAYEQRIKQLENAANLEQGNPSMRSTVAQPDARQMVEGSMVGFIETKEGQTVPALFLAPDGQPDMVFLPKIKGQQDTDLKLAGGELRTFETFFGRKRFSATLLTKTSNGNFHVQAIKLPDTTVWPVQSALSYSKQSSTDKRVGIESSAVDLGPVIETFNNYCDPPGDSGVRVTWKATSISLDKQIVVRVPWREFPCQGPREEPSSNSHWRRFIGSAPLMMGDLREGAFAFIWIKPIWPQHVATKTTAISEITYLLHLDSRRSYAPVEMLSPEVMLLDSVLMKPFRERVKTEFDGHNTEVSNCRNIILDRRPPNRKLTAEEVTTQNKELAKCNTWWESPEFSEAQFIQTFVPEQWRHLWAR